MRRAAALAFVCVAASACGPKKPTAAELEAARQAAEMRARAETRVLEGCYDCLLEAKAAYTKLATGTDRPQVLVRLFEVELLLGLREKELAMTSAATASVGRARTLVPDLPPPAAAAAERYLAAADAAVPDETGLSVAAGRNFRRQTVKYVEGLDTEINWILGESSFQLPVRQYVALALDCSYYRRGRPLQRPAVTGQPIAAAPTRQVVMEQIGANAATLVRYRAGFCDTIRRAPLEQVRKEEARYAEAAYFLARLDIARAQETGAPGARQLLAEAYGRFPTSPAVTYLNGNYQQLIGDCKAALRFYVETLVIEKLHDNALLGRTVCFAFLKRFDESIASATEMIEIPSSNLAEAFYWRAWVKHTLKRFDDARADIEKAKQILSNNDIHRLAGIIEYDQEDHLNAQKDLTAAKSMHGGESDCVARWYLGLNDMKRLRWVESAINFEDAMYCYERAALYAAEGLKKMQAAENLDPDFKARQIAGFEAAIKEDTAQQYASAFNAANHYARAGERAKAKSLVEVAAKDPALEARVTELRRILSGGK